MLEYVEQVCGQMPCYVANHAHSLLRLALALGARHLAPSQAPLKGSSEKKRFVPAPAATPVL